MGREWQDMMSPNHSTRGCPEYDAMMQKKSPYDSMNEQIAARRLAESNQEVIRSTKSLTATIQTLNERIAALNQEEEPKVFRKRAK